MQSIKEGIAMEDNFKDDISCSSNESFQEVISTEGNKGMKLFNDYGPSRSKISARNSIGRKKNDGMKVLRKRFGSAKDITSFNRVSRKVKSIAKAFSPPGRRQRGKRVSFPPATADDKKDHSNSRQHRFQPDYEPPTDLHSLCFSASSSIDLINFKSLHSPLDEGLKTDAVQRDSDGRIPLNLLLENRKLISSLSNRPSEIYDNYYRNHRINVDTQKVGPIVDFVLSFLLPANISCLVEQDNDGYTPFERVLVDWIDHVHQTDFYHNQSKRTFGMSVFKPVIARASKSLHLSQSHNFCRENSIGLNILKGQDNALESTRSIQVGSRSSSFESLDSVDCHEDAESGLDIEFLDCSNHHFDKTQFISNLSKEQTHSLESTNVNRDLSIRVFPSNVEISPQMEYTLYLLSTILDFLDEKIKEEKRIVNGKISNKVIGKTNIRLSRESSDEAENFVPLDSTDENNTELKTKKNTASELRHELIRKISSIPNLVKTFLLIDDDEDRKRIFEFSAVHRVMLKKQSVNRWLIYMLQNHNKQVNQRAVDYLRLLSDATENAKKTHDVVETKYMQNKLDELHRTVGALDGLIPSMLALEEKMIEEAATTHVISRVLDEMITRPFAVSTVFFDALFLALLIFTFRKSVEGFLLGEVPEDVIKWIYAANAIVFYFVIRELGKAVSLARITATRVFWLKFWSFWNIVDIFSIVMALSSTIVMRGNLGKFVLQNHESNQVRVCLAVTTGLLWLRVLSLLKTVNMQLATFVLAIAQITRDILWFLVILVATILCFAQIFYALLVPDYCSTDQTKTIDCSSNEYYLKVYSILLGDYGLFDREDFTTAFATFLFVFFSFMIVIVLLNVLIAIVRSKNLFGRARVLLLAEVVSFQELFQKRPHHHASGDRNTSNPNFSQCWRKGASGGLIFFCLSGSVVIAWILAEYAFYKSEEAYGDIIFSIGSICINIAILLVISLVLSRKAEGGDSGNVLQSYFSGFYKNSIQSVMIWLLGTSEETLFSKDNDDEWRGRVFYLQKEMTRVTAESSRQIRSALKYEVRTSKNRTKEEMQRLDNQIQNLDKKIMSQLKAAEQRIKTIVEKKNEEISHLIYKTP